MPSMEEYIKENLHHNAPKNIDLKVGDVVDWINDDGVMFRNKVIGFDNGRLFSMRYKRYVHLNTNCWWFPHSHNELIKVIQQIK